MFEISCEIIHLARSSLKQKFGFTINIFDQFKHQQNLLVSRYTTSSF